MYIHVCLMLLVTSAMSQTTKFFNAPNSLQEFLLDAARSPFDVQQSFEFLLNGSIVQTITTNITTTCENAMVTMKK